MQLDAHQTKGSTHVHVNKYNHTNTTHRNLIISKFAQSKNSHKNVFYVSFLFIFASSFSFFQCGFKTWLSFFHFILILWRDVCLDLYWWSKEYEKRKKNENFYMFVCESSNYFFHNLQFKCWFKLFFAFGRFLKKT